MLPFWFYRRNKFLFCLAPFNPTNTVVGINRNEKYRSIVVVSVVAILFTGSPLLGQLLNLQTDRFQEIGQ